MNILSALDLVSKLAVFVLWLSHRCCSVLWPSHRLCSMAVLCRRYLKMRMLNASNGCFDLICRNEDMSDLLDMLYTLDRPFIIPDRWWICLSVFCSLALWLEPDIYQCIAPAVVEIEHHQDYQIPRIFSESSSSVTSERSMGGQASGQFQAHEETIEPRCYLPNTAFKCPSGKFILVQDIEEGEQLVAFDSQGRQSITRVLRNILYPKNRRDPFTIVIIKTAQGNFLLSSSHRVPVKRNDQVITRTASALAEGEFVQVGSKWLPVLSKTPQRRKVDLYMIATANQCVLEAFPVPFYGLQTFTDAAFDEHAVGTDTPHDEPSADLNSTELLHLIGCSNISVQDLTDAQPSSYED